MWQEVWVLGVLDLALLAAWVWVERGWVTWEWACQMSTPMTCPQSCRSLPPLCPLHTTGQNEITPLAYVIWTGFVCPACKQFIGQPCCKRLALHLCANVMADDDSILVLEQAMQNPAMQQAMQQMMSQPQMMEALTQNAVNNNPQLRQMLDSDPRLR